MDNASNNILSGIRYSITEIPKTTVNEYVYILHRLQILEITVFERTFLCPAHQGCIYLIKNTAKTVVLCTMKVLKITLKKLHFKISLLFEYILKCDLFL